jgi:hypothetical protein
MSPLPQLLCLFCLSSPSVPYPQAPQQAGDIVYRHEVLSHGKHLLRLSTTDFILDTGHMRKHRMDAFARGYADRTCGGHYRLIEWNQLTTYAGQIVFVCR